MQKITITDHARERVLERIGCAKRKVERLVFKAWRSTEEVILHDVANIRFHEKCHKGKQIFYRRLMEMTYIFCEGDEDEIVLLTVLPPSSVIARERRLKTRWKKQNREWNARNEKVKVGTPK